jgi:hypothetical protein
MEGTKNSILDLSNIKISNMHISPPNISTLSISPPNLSNMHISPSDLSTLSVSPSNTFSTRVSKIIIFLNLLISITKNPPFRKSLLSSSQILTSNTRYIDLLYPEILMYLHSLSLQPSGSLPLQTSELPSLQTSESPSLQTSESLPLQTLSFCNTQLDELDEYRSKLICKCGLLMRAFVVLLFEWIRFHPSFDEDFFICACLIAEISNGSKKLRLCSFSDQIASFGDGLSVRFITEGYQRLVENKENSRSSTLLLYYYCEFGNLLDAAREKKIKFFLRCEI